MIFAATVTLVSNTWNALTALRTTANGPRTNYHRHGCCGENEIHSTATGRVEASTHGVETDVLQPSNKKSAKTPRVDIRTHIWLPGSDIDSDTTAA
jgi:hypothetical protein